MLFNYKEFLDELKEDENKRELYDKWSQISNAERIEDEPFYEYLQEFSPIQYKVPVELMNDFDWNLLLQLIVSSFSSSYEIELLYDDDYIFGIDEIVLPELVINVYNGGMCVAKKVSDLWSFQIQKLFEIYCEEQLNCQILNMEDDFSGIDDERKMRIKAYNIKRKTHLQKMKRFESMNVKRLDF